MTFSRWLASIIAVADTAELPDGCDYKDVAAYRSEAIDEWWEAVRGGCDNQSFVAWMATKPDGRNCPRSYMEWFANPKDSSRVAKANTKEM